MKKFMLVLLMGIMVSIILTSCGMMASAATTTVQNDSSRLRTDYEGALPLSMQLILGTIKLQDTQNALTAKQAAALLPIWKGVRILSKSDTAAQEEKDALWSQIQETMTAEQIQAIADMKISRKDFGLVTQKLGIAFNPAVAGNPQGAPARQQGTQTANGQSGGNIRIPGVSDGPGGPPPGGFPGAPGQNSRSNSSSQRNSNSGMTNQLYDAFIKYMENIAQLTPASK